MMATFRFRLFFCILLMAVLITSPACLAQETPDGLAYEISQGEAVITGYRGEAADVVIPDTLEGYPVAQIGSYAFSQSKVRSVALPKGLHTIGSAAFQHCENLTGIEIPNGVTEIPYAAFTRSGLETVSIPEGVVSIGHQAFNGCEKLKSVAVAKSVTHIFSLAFADCTELSSVDIKGSDVQFDEYAFKNTAVTDISFLPSALTDIPYGMFSDTPIKELVLPTGVKRIGEKAFENTLIERLDLPEGVTEIGPFAFRECAMLKTVKLPSSVTQIGASAFINCRALKEMEPPAGMTYIPDGFYVGTGVEEIVIRDNITKVGDSAFYQCAKLKSVKLNNAAEIASRAFSETGISEIDLSGVKILGEAVFSGCKSLESVALPGDLKQITWQMFSYCDKLASLELPSSVEYIADEAFFLSGIRSVNLPEGLKSIGKAAFSGCAGMSRIDLPKSLESLGERALEKTGISELVIPGGVTDIKDNLANGCSDLKKVVLPDGLKSIGAGAFRLTALETVDIPNSVESLGDYCFGGCGKLKSIDLPANVKSIPRGAFAECGSLSGIDLTGIADIGDYAFENCGITSVHIERSCKSVGINAFNNCSELRRAFVDCDSVGSYAFAGCSSLAEVKLASLRQIAQNMFSGCSSLARVDIPSSVERVETGAFSDCPNLTVIDVPESVEYMEDSAEALFGGSPNVVLYVRKGSYAHVYAYERGVPFLVTDGADDFDYVITDGAAILTRYNGDAAKLTLPDKLGGAKLAAIFNAAFGGNTTLREITLGKNLLVIGERAFMGCSALRSARLPATVVQIGENAFSQCPDLTLLVDSGSAAESYARENGIAYRVYGSGKLVESIELTGKNSETSGRKVKLTAVVLPADALNKTLVWRSDSPGVASVNKNGVVKLKKTLAALEARITAEARDGSGVSAEFVITVLPKVKKVVINAPQGLIIDLNAGDTRLTLEADVEPIDAARVFKWKSGNTKILTVDQNGVVTAVKPGFAKITATAADGSGKKAAVKVTVK